MTNTTKLVIYGAGAYARVFYNECIRTKAREVAAFTVDQEYLLTDQLYDLPVVAFEKCTELYPPSEYEMLVVCGYMKMRERKVMFEKAKKCGYRLGNYISPDAYVEAGFHLGENNIIFTNAFIGCNVTLGDDNFIRQNVYVGHNGMIGDHNIISSGVTIGGNLKMGNLSFIGLGATIIDSVILENECLIGAGSVVVKNVKASSKYFGNPAKLISMHTETGVCFK